MPEPRELPQLPIPPAGDFRGAQRWMAEMRRLQLPRGADEGLREHKKRMTRQQISDTATWMFGERGYHAVRVADVADAVGVSEKTVFNYFPTKESLVFDREDAITEQLVGAVRDRSHGTSPVQAVVASMEGEDARFGVVPEEAIWMLRAFDDLISSTPELVAAQRAMTSRIIAAMAAVLGEELELDPRDPEPQIVAHALMGLWELRESSMSRHMDEGLAGAELQRAVHADLARAARVLETGLWALHIVSQGRQIADTARAINEARREIAGAVRDARDAWRKVRSAQVEKERRERDAQRDARQAAARRARDDKRRARRGRQA